MAYLFFVRIQGASAVANSAPLQLRGQIRDLKITKTHSANKLSKRKSIIIVESKFESLRCHVFKIIFVHLLFELGDSHL
jgi:hypothetical protein